MAEQVHDLDRRRLALPGPGAPVELVDDDGRVQVVGPRLRVDERHRPAEVADRVGGRDEGQRRDQHLVAGADVEDVEAEVDGRGPRGAGDGEPGPHGGRERGLEAGARTARPTTRSWSSGTPRGSAAVFPPSVGSARAILELDNGSIRGTRVGRAATRSSSRSRSRGRSCASQPSSRRASDGSDCRASTSLASGRTRSADWTTVARMPGEPTRDREQLADGLGATRAELDRRSRRGAAVVAVRTNPSTVSATNVRSRRVSSRPSRISA